MEKIALIFPGQGSQYTGMGKTLYDKFPVARKTFEEANEILGFDLGSICFGGSLVELNRLENMMLAILTVSVAAFRVYMEEIGIAPLLSAGHSLGEYSALACSGALSFHDALRVVRKRSIFAQEAADIGHGAMCVVNGVYKNIVEEECRKNSREGQTVGIACYNSPEQVVISGHNEAVTRVEDGLMELDAQITPILISAPFHSPLMKQAADKLKEELEKCTFNRFNWPVVSNVSALPYENEGKIVRNLTLQITRPVQWQAIMRYMQEQGITTYIEMGPQAVLSNLVRLNMKDATAISFGQEDDRRALLEKFSPKKVNSGEQEAEKSSRQAPTVVTRCLAIAVCTRNRNWNDEEYQKGVVEPCEKIEHMQEQLEREGVQPTIEQMREALEMLRSVFNVKKVPLDKQVQRFNQIFEETGTRDIFSDFKIQVVD